MTQAWEIKRKEIRISLYEDGSFASAKVMVAKRPIVEGVPWGTPELDWVDLDEGELSKISDMIGRGVVEQRGHVDRVESQVIEMRRSHRAEVDQLNEELAAKTQRVAALEAEKTARK